MQLTGLALSAANDRAQRTAICMVAVPKTALSIYTAILKIIFTTSEMHTPITDLAIIENSAETIKIQNRDRSTGRVTVRRRKYGGGNDLGVLASVVV